MRQHPAYKTWCDMRQRCSDPKGEKWHRYGGRGITVCPEWQNSFEAFWRDMGDWWAPGLTIERMDNNGNYEKSNCRWVVQALQANNTSRNIFIDTPKGRMSIARAARAFGFKQATLQRRLKHGVPNDRLFDPLRYSEMPHVVVKDETS